MTLVIAGIALWVATVVAIIVGVAYHARGFNKVCCATCGGQLRECDSIEHGGDPCAYTHPGVCADKHAKVHVAMYYGDGDTH